MDMSPQIELLYISLKNKTLKAMNDISIPENKKDSSGLQTQVINQGDLFGNINLLRNWGDALGLRACHMMRTGLYSIDLINHLNIENKEWRHNMFTAYLWHDVGKDLVEGFNDAFMIDVNKPFTEKSLKLMEWHVDSEQLGDLFTPTIKAIVTRHHFYRKKNPYPQNPWGEETPEVKYLAQRLGIVDSYDAASTRVNNRTKITLIDKLFKKRFQSQKLIKKMLIEDYGEQRLEYDRDFFPYVKQTGKEFIEEMYSKEIFGRENRFNPFEN